METSAGQKTLGVKYLSHGNQCQVPIDLTCAQMLSLVKHMDIEPQVYLLPQEFLVDLPCDQCASGVSAQG